ncbi:hypothetical protein HAZT_HAZT011029 [Hyalella azteca]|uniref:Uncharacterized protein n=1 Tax=Hyalella azteca TaxID=294128 RepID=A0A6A0HA72_HYAAZ|nr:hypothetical protein HAZT_HAZT011029 [Hyalella azteca]
MLGYEIGALVETAHFSYVFHVCLPIADEIGALVETAHFSFICGNETVFSQDSLTCTYRDEAFPCDQARTLYDLSNAEFGRIPEKK